MQNYVLIPTYVLEVCLSYKFNGKNLGWICQS